MSVKSLVKSTLLLGSTSAATAVVGMIRVKILAVLLGPAGLGLLGTLAGMASVGTTLFAGGADTSGTRRLALARGDAAAVVHLHRTLVAIAIVHGLAATALFWTLREPLSSWIFDSNEYTGEVALLGLAVALSLLAGLRIALLQGLGRVRDIARVGLLSSLIATFLGLIAVWQIGTPGLIVLIIAQPAVAALLASRYVPHEARITAPTSGTNPVIGDWRTILGEGAAFMVSYLMLALVPLAVRAMVIQDLGLEAAGHFHAAWTMSVIYIGFLLNAMSADYFPRLTGLIAAPDRATSLINDQIQVGLAIGGPVLLVMLAGAPWIVPLLYAKAFAPAAQIIEWQALGNLMKIAGWPIAFLSMARGRSGQFLALELSWTTLFFVLVWLGLPYLGLTMTGIGFAIACGAFLILQTVVAWKTYGFKWRRDSALLLLAYTIAGAATLAAAHHSTGLQAGVGATAALILGITSLRSILGKTGAEGRMAIWLERAFATVGWPLPSASATETR